MTNNGEPKPPGDEQPAIGEGAEEVFTPELLRLLLTLNEDEMIAPLRLKRTDVTRVKGVKLNDAETRKVNEVIAFLHDRGYIPDPTFAALFVYCFNLMFHYHSKAAAQEAKEEVAPS
jgi:SOS response regulatory protein OraA/RecX